MKIASSHRAQQPEGDRPMSREEADRLSREVIKGRAQTEPKMDDPATRATVARNLYEIVQEAKVRGVKMRTVVPNALGLKDERLKVLPTKRLWWYTLRPDRQDDASIKKLHKNTENYVRIAQEIAKALAPKIGDDENYYLPRLFRGTEYAGEPSELERRKTPTHLARLQDDLREMVAGIAAQYKLAEYFERLWEEQVPTDRLDPEKHWVGSARIHPYSVFLPPNYDDGVIYAGEIGGLPTVPLYCEPFGAKIPARLAVSRNRIGNSGTGFPTRPDRVAWARPIKATVTLWRDVRLSICPVPMWEYPQPVLEVRQAVTVETAYGEFDLRDLVISIEDPHEFPLRRGKLYFLAKVEDRRDRSARAFDLDVNGPDQENAFETHNISFFHVNRQSCQRYLERELGPTTQMAKCLPTVISGTTGFPENQIGAYVAESLYDLSECGLYSLMIHEVQRRKNSLDHYCRERDGALEARRAAARRRWLGK
jgi:hypothetical protein